MSESNGRKFMMATEAWGGKDGALDISRDEPDLCMIHSETIGAYVGSWVTGMGFFNVRFPKKSTRELSPMERQYYRDHEWLLTPQGKRSIAIDEERPVACIGEGDL